MAGVSFIVGLGNPGRAYAQTPHNAGFWFLQAAAAALRAELRARKEFFGDFCRAENFFLLRPNTFMNESGRAAAAATRFYKIARAQILIAHDDLDLPSGEARLKFGGGEAGHNGLRSVSAHLGGKDYWRLRLGIGRPPAGVDGGDYVLRRAALEVRQGVEAAAARALILLPLLAQGEMEKAVKELHTPEIFKEREAKKRAQKKSAADDGGGGNGDNDDARGGELSPPDESLPREKQKI